MSDLYICGHSIEFYLTDDNDNTLSIDLPESDEEHLTEMITQGYVSGELCSMVYLNEDDEEPTECHGWWNIQS